MVNDYAEQFFESMKIVAKYYYDDKKFDETIIATIVDDSGRKQGRYIVTNGTIKFDAYADSQDYKVNDVVRVTILKGDYSDKKYIVGKGVKNETGSAVTLVPPSDTILNMTGNLVSIDEKDKLKLIANSGNHFDTNADKNASYEAKQLWRIPIDDETYSKQWQNSTYDSIVLKADFSSRLSNYSPSAGHYGLWLDVYILMSEDRKTVIQKRFYLDSKDMFGDPYNFIAPSLQEISFHLTPGEKISAMELYFYQSNDFVLKTSSNQELKDKADDIWVDNICLYLGNDISKIEDNKLVIHTHDSLLYNGSGIEETRQRILELTWYNKNENNQYLGFSDGRINKDYSEIEYLNSVKNSPEDDIDYSEYDNLYCIYWYKYVDSYPGDNDPLGEQNWQRIITKTPNIGLPNVEQDEGYYPVYAEQTTLTVEPDITESVSKYKAVLIYNHELYHSNELVFTNVVQSTATPTLNNISIVHADNSKDAYPIYGIDGKLINMADYAKIRKIKVQYLDGWGQLSNKYLANATVYWYIPVSDTMLRYYEYDYDDFQKEETTITQKDGYKCFYKTIKTNEAGLIEDQYLFFPYRIKDYYVLSNKNNKIYCVIKTATQTLETFIDFSFSSFGNSGTDYSLIIKPIGPEIVITQNPNQKCKFEISLYNSNNENIDISNLDMDISIDNNQITSNFDNQILTINSVNAGNRQGGILTVKLPVQDDGLWPKEIIGQYAIPWAWESTYHMIGTSTIVYDSYGGAPVYYREPLVLCDGKEKIENGNWSIEYHYSSNTDDNNKLKERQFLPIIKDNILIPCNMYVANTIGASLVYKNDEGRILYSQPLLITQNKYPSSMLNGWDGELVLNETNETILTNLMGSGKKELDNTFSGVVLGEIASAGIDNELTDAENSLRYPHTGVGLYGFHHGEQSFGFNVNGTAFIGKSGGGRIAFDGNQGFIYSSNWLNSPHYDKQGNETNDPFRDENGVINLNPGTQGMAIDLQSGHIDANDFKLTSSGILLNSNPSEDPDSNDKYYLAIGNLQKIDSPTSTYIRYDSSGNLEIKVSKFELIGAYGANNLLNNTAPLQPTVDTITTGEPKHGTTKDNIINDPNDKSAWTSDQRKIKNNEIVPRLCVWSALQGKGNDVYKCIGIDNHPQAAQLDSERIIYQKFSDTDLTARQYILTGYIWNNGNTNLILILGEGDKSIEYTYSQQQPQYWNKIEFIFDLEKDGYTSLPSKLTIVDKPSLDKTGTNYPATYFRELKLEQGSISTSWTSSVFDIEGYNKTVIDAELKKFETTLDQEYIFNKLTNNGSAGVLSLNENNTLLLNPIGTFSNDAGMLINSVDNTFALATNESTYIKYNDESGLVLSGLTHTGKFIIDGDLQLGSIILTAEKLQELLDLLNKGEEGL